MPILVGIDGTDDSFLLTAKRNQRYDAAFADSFVRRIAGAGGRYFRGPVTQGTGLVDAVDQAVDHVRGSLARAPDQPVLLTGYSRGGAGVVVVAKRLERLGIPVQAMMLFDAVDRHAVLGAYGTPSNVQFVHHVLRHPSSGSRESFENAATQWAGPPITEYTEGFYRCTHGGMGGMPWPDEGAEIGTSPWRPRGRLKRHHIVESLPDGPTNVTFEQDAKESARVWRDVQPFLRRHGFVASA